MKAVRDYQNRTLTLSDCSAEEVRLILQVVDESEILVLLHNIKHDTETLIMTDLEFAQILTTIDTNTTKIGANVEAIGTVATTIGTEVDDLITKLTNAGVSQALVDQATAIGNRAQAISDASDALVPVLQAIASKGAGNPVPVPVPEVPPAG